MATAVDEERKAAQVKAPAFPQNPPPGGSIYAGARRPDQAIREAMPAMAQAVDDAKERATSAFQQGNTAAGVGQIARGAVVAPLVAATEVGANLLGAAKDIGGAVVKPVAQAAYSAVTGSNDQVFQGGATPATPQAPISQRATLPSPTPGTGSVGAGSRAATAVDNLQTRAAAPVAAPAPAAAQPDNGFQETSIGGVYRRGNTFTDAAGTQDTAFLNRGAITPQNRAAGEALAGRYGAMASAEAQRPSVAGLGGMAFGARPRAQTAVALNDLRSPEAIALRNAAVGGMPRSSYNALFNELTAGARQAQTAEMQDAGATQRALIQESGALGRTAIQENGQMTRAGMTNEVQRGELAVKQGEFGLRSRVEQRLQGAQDDYIKADTPEKQALALRRLQALTGRGGEKFTVVRGGQEWDERAGAMRNVPDMVIDSQGRPIAVGGAGQSQRQQGPAPGTVQDGFRFKGGNPADQSNWEKVR